MIAGGNKEVKTAHCEGCYLCVCASVCVCVSASVCTHRNQYEWEVTGRGLSHFSYFCLHETACCDHLSPLPASCLVFLSLCSVAHKHTVKGWSHSPSQKAKAWGWVLIMLLFLFMEGQLHLHWGMRMMQLPKYFFICAASSMTLSFWHATFHIA